MKELLEKLSTYNLFNYLLPGAIFAVLAGEFTSYSFRHEDIVLSLFAYYFIGLVISRVGSLALEPLLKRINLLRFAPYRDFIAASRKDEGLTVLSEANNMYRTISSLFATLLLLRGYEALSSYWPALQLWRTGILVAALLALFCLSYLKQTNYIRRRVEAHMASNEDGHE